MQVVEIVRPGGPDVLAVTQREKPSLEPGEVLVRVAAASVNRPDVQQRRGLYPPPPGASDIPGLDIAGVVEAVAANVAWPRVGEAVCALVSGGGYAEFCKAPAVQCMPIPKGLDLAQAAALPEVLFTCWNSVIWLGRLGEGETILVQGGTSGVGMATIQIARLLRNAHVYATAGTEEKRAVCRRLGAIDAIDYRGDWDHVLLDRTEGRGFDVIVDGQAGSYTDRHLNILALDGRLVLLASHLGERADINARQIVRRRLTLAGATLRPRPPAYKARIAQELVRDVWPLLESGQMAIDVCAMFPLADAANAHAVLDANEQIGKVVLIVHPELLHV